MQRVAHPGSDGFHNVATLFTGSTTGVDDDACAPFTPPTSPPPLAYTGMPMATEPGIALALLLLGAGASDAAAPATSNQPLTVQNSTAPRVTTIGSAVPQGMVNRHARQSCLSGLARWSGHPGAKSVEKPHAVAVGDRCRVDAIAEVVEEVLDPAGDGDDEFARRAAEDVVAVRDPSG